MIYFDWVNTFEKLKSSPIDYDLLKELEDKKLDGDDYVLQHLISHIIDTVNTRLNTCFEKFLERIVIGNIDVNILSLELIQLKKEIKFNKKIVNLSIIPNDSRKQFMSTLDNAVNNIYDILRKNLKYVDDDGEFLSVFDQIMVSDVEE